MKAYDHYVRLARYYLETGKEEEARETILRWRLRSPMIDEVHFEWGRLCEELDMTKPAMDSYARALKINPAHEGALLRLAQLLYETGYHGRSAHYLKKFLRRNPTNTDARKLLCLNYEKLGLGKIAQMIAGSENVPDQSDHERYFPPSIGRENIERFMELFSGRETGFVIQKVNSSTGSVSYDFNPEPLSADIIAKHLLGELTLGIYPLRSDNTVRFGIVSLRIPSGVRERYSGQLSYFTLLDEKMRTHVIRMSRIANSIGIPAYPEKSGYQQYRLWFFFENFEHLLRVKRFLTDFLNQVPEKKNDFIVEVILPTRSVGVGWKEHPVLLPLGVDRVSMERCLFIESSGAPCENQLKHIERIRPFSLRWGIGRLKAMSRDKSVELTEGELSGVVKKLISRCPVVDYLVKKSLAGHMLRNPEKVVLFYTLGLIDEGGYTIHRLLQATPDYNYKKVKNQLERLKKHPISCVKIRTLLPEITASLHCNCSFDLRGGKYPSPLMHVVPDMVPVMEDFQVPGRTGLRETAERYVNLHRQIAEQRGVLSKLEKKLDECFSKRGISEYRTGKFCIKRYKADDRSEWIVEYR